TSYPIVICLHPFPTRRSSDVARQQVGVGTSDIEVGIRLDIETVHCLFKEWHLLNLIQEDVGHPIRLQPFLDITVERLIIQQCLIDRKSTRLNSSHVSISYAVF